MSTFDDQFKQPPNGYRSMPLWVWNGDMTEGRITEMLEQYAQQGMGGVFVHPRPGLITEYLSERWFELWGHALSECKRLGLQCNVYDENSYPSGFAGGHVPSTLPHGAGQHLHATFYKHSPVRLQGELIACYKLEDDRLTRLESHVDLNQILDNAEQVIQKTHLPLTDPDSGALGPVGATETQILVLERRRHSGTPWTAWLPYVDQTRLDVARAFLESTHERYYAHFKEDFGETIRAFFIDEPHLGLAEHTGDVACLPFSRHILRAFRKDHDYDLADHLADLFLEQPSASITRFDYYSTLQRLWSENFLRVIHEWCEERGVSFTGHFLEHDWPYPHTNPNCMEANRWLHIPGIDLLSCQFDYQHPQDNRQLLLTVREVNSLANQLNRERRFCEAHGVAGYDADFTKLKQLTDWLVVHGINFINEHLSFQTIHGNRKYDHPVTFSDHSPWWSQYRYLNDHTARLCTVMSQGVQRNRFLLLQPTTTGWVRANPTQPFAYSFAHAASVNTPNVQLRNAQAGLIADLAAHQIDFDLGDEFYLRDFGRVVGKKLKIHAGRYDVVIVPEFMDNCCDSTLRLLERFLEAGGIVMCIGVAPRLVNGRPDPRPAALHNTFPTRWWVYPDFDAMLVAIDEHFPAYLRTADGGHLPPAIAVQTRFHDDGRVVHFLVNTEHEPLETEVLLEGKSLRLLDSFTGDIHGLLTRPHNSGGLLARLRLPALGHALWEVNAKTAAPKPELKVGAPYRIDTGRALVNGPNMLTLDYCDLSMDNSSHHGLPVPHANRLCWQWHGFDADIWTCAVQFRKNNEKYPIEPDSGFTVSYHFEVAPNAYVALREAEKIALAVEHPHLYNIRVNDMPIDADTGERWLDETIRAMPIARALRPGTNVVTLQAAPFNIHHEIERVYIVGDFTLTPSNPGFRIVQPKSVYLGDWTEQGYPMFSGSMSYQAPMELETACHGLQWHVPEWAGAVMQVRLDGEALGHIAFPPYTVSVYRDFPAGHYNFEIEVFGTPKNLLGPHHAPGAIPGPGTWDLAPKAAPAGEAYEIQPQGLLGPIKVYPLTRQTE